MRRLIRFSNASEGGEMSDLERYREIGLRLNAAEALLRGFRMKRRCKTRYKALLGVFNRLTQLRGDMEEYMFAAGIPGADIKVFYTTPPIKGEPSMSAAIANFDAAARLTKEVKFRERIEKLSARVAEIQAKVEGGGK